ncbi:site-specific DNA-methyltransferase [Helicobacter anatolicus]|uniref:site-specific DNA-methyltransferase n=1 Tax=Helicobacter anatolicus TaxID=2905874 RepID=UPI003A0FD22E
MAKSTNNKQSLESNLSLALTNSPNLLIKGNNLLALHSLKSKYAKQVKLIYIDPPYNTGNDSFNYNDRFNHSTWLTFMKNRLEVAKEFLRDDGVIFVQCDDNEQAYLKVLMDEIFGRENYLRTTSIKKKQSAGVGQDTFILDVTEYLLIYAKSKNTFTYEKYSIDVKFDSKQMENYKNYVAIKGRTLVREDKDKKGETVKIYKLECEICKASNLTHENFIKNFDCHFTTYNPQSTFAKRIISEIDGNFYEVEYKPLRGKNQSKTISIFFYKKRIVQMLNSISYISGKQIIKKQILDNFWNDMSWDTIGNQGGVSFNNGKKPEALLQRIIEISTNENDLIMDFFAGSGTTLAVAHKMHRRYIGIEQMDYIESITKERLKKVIDGEQGGISKAVKWSGGGNFIYAELMPLNAIYKEKIANSKDEKELEKIYQDLESKAFLDYRVDLEDVIKDKDFKDLDLENKKEVLKLILDSNMDYLPYGDIEDNSYEIDTEVIELNRIFYEDK